MMVAQVGLNAIRLAADHTSNNDTKVKRAIVTFKPAGIPAELSKLRIHYAQSNGHDSGVSLAQRRRPTAQSTQLFAPRGQHCSAT